MDWTKTTTRRDKNNAKFWLWWDLYLRFYDTLDSQYSIADADASGNDDIMHGTFRHQLVKLHCTDGSVRVRRLLSTQGSSQHGILWWSGRCGHGLARKKNDMNWAPLGPECGPYPQPLMFWARACDFPAAHGRHTSYRLIVRNESNCSIHHIIFFK